ncbi:SH3 domain-containing protein [Robertmurraya kyonggiensis]|uniref:N-acetylmuramoyl-L-alanine amidase n=1 Tax=Robertmurraya kyonggiensis TaxID=1037680 RepID=A0A4V5P3M2_9BACI|nr:SH3 domain-containing protein [Robertmurraya kyonggiensis]TKC20050.1 N-acetylmuramoyl-L-alanine amidase [Robertmurraya kyonggiensis]
MLKTKQIYLLLSLILFVGVITPAKQTSAAGTITISVEDLNVREGPGLSYKVIEKVQKNKQFTLVKEQGDWYQIKLSSGKSGWVANWLVSKKETTSTTNATSQNGTITGSNVRVRTGAGTSYQVVGSLNKGDTVEILEQSGSWLKINAKIGKGWISKDYVKTNQVQAAATKSGKVTASNLNVRSTPALNGKVLGKLAKGTAVTIHSEKTGWVEITFNGQRAWVSSEFVSTQSTPTSTTPSTPSTPSASTAGVTGKVTATSLNVRSKGDLSGQVVGNVSKGQSLKILEEANNWVKIEYKTGKTGWIASWYIEKSASTSSSSDSVKNSTLTIDNNGTNIRSSASLNASVIARADAGQTFSIVKIHNDWYEIKLANGKSGFVAGWIVTVSSGVPQVEKTNSSSDLKNQKIVIDPGHGGRDSGTIGAQGSLEKELTLKTSQLLYNKLKARGANVVLTRSNDQYVSLATRVSMAHYQNADAFISIHFDSINDRTVRGMTSYYYHSYQKDLAQTVHKATIAQTKMKDRGVRQGNYHVIRENRQDAILLELGYLSNPTEEMLVKTSQYQDQVTNGIVQGLSNYFN